MNTRLIILAGGLSSRMKRSLAEEGLDAKQIQQANQRPKGLIELDAQGNTFIDYLLSNAHQAGYTTVYLVVGEDSKLFKERFNDHPFLEVKYATQYIPENRTKPLGTADAVLQAMEQHTELQHETFSVCNSDNLYSVKVLESLRNSEAKNVCVAYDREALDFPKERIARFAVMRFSDTYHLTEIVEKPDIQEVYSYKDRDGIIRVSMNIFAFSGAMCFPFFRDCPLHPERSEKEIPTVITLLLKEHPKAMKGIPVSEHVPDLTSKEDLLKMTAFFKKPSNS